MPRNYDPVPRRKQTGKSEVPRQMGQYLRINVFLVTLFLVLPWERLHLPDGIYRDLLRKHLKQRR